MTATPEPRQSGSGISSLPPIAGRRRKSNVELSRGQERADPEIKNSANLGRRAVLILMASLVALLVACDASGMPPQPHIDPRSLLLFGLIVLFLLLAWLSGNRWERRRRQAVSAVGAQLGFAFEPKGVLLPDWRELRVFRKHASEKVQNVLRAHRGDWEVLFFDYECAEANGDQGAKIVSQTMAAFRLNRGNLPSFGVHPGVFLNRLPAWLASALDVVPVDSPHPDFARHYVVEARRRNHIAVRQLFSPGVQRSLAGLDTDHEWSIEGAGEWLVLYRFDRLPKPEAYVEFVQKATAIADALNDAGFGKGLLSTAATPKSGSLR